VPKVILKSERRKLKDENQRKTKGKTRTPLQRINLKKKEKYERKKFLKQKYCHNSRKTFCTRQDIYREFLKLTSVNFQA